MNTVSDELMREMEAEYSDRGFCADLVDEVYARALLALKPEQPSQTIKSLDEQRDALIEAELKARNYPSNSMNAGRAGWYAAMKAQQAQGEPLVYIHDEVADAIACGQKLFTATVRGARVGNFNTPLYTHPAPVAQVPDDIIAIAEAAGFITKHPYGRVVVKNSKGAWIEVLPKLERFAALLSAPKPQEPENNAQGSA